MNPLNWVPVQPVTGFPGVTLETNVRSRLRGGVELLFDVVCVAKNWLLMPLGAVAVAALIERLRRPLPATPTHRMWYGGSTKEIAR